MLENRLQEVVGNLNPKPILMDGICTLHQGDVQIMEGKGVNPTPLSLGLAAALSGEGDFLGMKTAEKSKVLYLNGTTTLSDLRVLSQKFSESPPEIKFLCDEDFSGENWDDGMFNVLNPVFQTLLTDYLAEEKDVKAVFFDQVPSTPMELKGEKAILGLRRLIVDIRKLGKLQAWVFPESKSIPPFPSELATAAWTVTPKGNQEGQGMEIKMAETMNASARGKTHHIRIIESENGLLRVVLRDRADLITVLNLISKGMSQTQIGDYLGYNQSTVSREFKGLGLEDDGLIRKNGTGYVVTNAGMTYLENATK